MKISKSAAFMFFVLCALMLLCVIGLVHDTKYARYVHEPHPKERVLLHDGSGLASGDAFITFDENDKPHYSR